MKKNMLPILLGAALAAHAGEPAALKFAFGARTPDAGWTQVAPINFYSDAAGFGFESGAEVSGNDYLTSEKPFLFSVKLPEGNYAVTALINDKTGNSVTTVKAEQRRLMLEKIQIHPGTLAARTFVVNVRTPRISSTEHVKLKQRELETETVNWDDKLTLEFNGTHPALRALVIAPTNVPTIFIAGDSTVCDQPAEPWNSWGQMLPRFFQPDVAVANYAESGESIKSSLGAKRFDKIFSLMKSGDYLFVQFGHNDQKDKATNALAVYKANLNKIVARTRELGGTPVLVTSMERKGGVARQRVAQTLRSIVRDTEALDLFADTGLPSGTGFIRELLSRLVSGLLPNPPETRDLADIFDRLFPRGTAADWLEQLDAPQAAQIIDLFQHDETAEEGGWISLRTDLEDAMGQLADRVCVVGSHRDVRARLGKVAFRDLSFQKLTPAVEALLARRQSGVPLNELAAELNVVRGVAEACDRAVDEVTGCLEKTGVSTALVYDIERLRAQVRRLELLLEAWSAPALEAQRKLAILADLVRQNHARRSVRELLRRLPLR